MCVRVLLEWDHEGLGPGRMLRLGKLEMMGTKRSRSRKTWVTKRCRRNVLKKKTCRRNVAVEERSRREVYVEGRSVVEVMWKSKEEVEGRSMSKKRFSWRKKCSRRNESKGSVCRRDMDGEERRQRKGLVEGTRCRRKVYYVGGTPSRRNKDVEEIVYVKESEQTLAEQGFVRVHWCELGRLKRLTKSSIMWLIRWVWVKEKTTLYWELDARLCHADPLWNRGYHLEGEGERLERWKPQVNHKFKQKLGNERSEFSGVDQSSGCSDCNYLRWLWCVRSSTRDIED